MTVGEFEKRTEELYNDLINDFKPLYEAIIDLRLDMGERIFEKFLNTAGQKIPLPARKSPGTSAGDYSPGYAKLKKTRPNPLELTSLLKNNFDGEPPYTNGLEAGIQLDPREYEKAQGLQYGKSVNPKYTQFSGYGVIFRPNKEEEERFLEDHSFRLAAEIQKRLNG
jgi:hypothetical protein